MVCRTRNTVKWIANGILFAIVLSMLVVSLLNYINLKLPTLKCEGNATTETSIHHKYNGETVGTIHLLTGVLVIPFIQMIITEWFYNNIEKNPYAYNYNASLGQSRWKRTLFYAGFWYKDYLLGFVCTLFVTELGKTVMNSPRPHWIDTCKPNFTAEACDFGWVSSYTCTNTQVSRYKLVDGHKSFPSGHASLGLYAALMMIIYQHKRVNMKKMGPVVLSVLHITWLSWALLAALSRVADHRHHAIDITIGGIWGCISGVLTAMFLCKSFLYRKESNGNNNYSGPKSVSNGGTIVMEGFCQLPMGIPRVPQNGPVDDRHTIRRLLSAQSNITQMSEICEDEEKV